MTVFRPLGLVKTLAAEKLPTKQIAERMETSVATAKRRLAEIGESRQTGRPSKLTDEEWNEIFDKVTSGSVQANGYDTLASQYGISKRTIQRKIKQMKNAIRSVNR